MRTLLDDMLDQARRDPPVVIADGRPQAALIEGVAVRALSTIVDRRGSVFEIFDKRWDWHPEPIDFAYCFTVRPNTVKGWGLHKRHQDRYCLIQGEIDLVLFDPREQSSTFKKISRIQMSEYHRCLVSIPAFVWHADHNIGSTDAVVVNFPTEPYDHADPDKYRLPIDTPLIPYDFGGASGG